MCPLDCVCPRGIKITSIIWHVTADGMGHADRGPQLQHCYGNNLVMSQVTYDIRSYGLMVYSCLTLCQLLIEAPEA